MKDCVLILGDFGEVPVELLNAPNIHGHVGFVMLMLRTFAEAEF
jgi:hypothetical protein